MAQRVEERRYDIGYGTLDAFKRRAQEAAATTDTAADLVGGRVVEWTRGESVFLVEFLHFYLSHVNEGLGTKNEATERFCMQMEAVGLLTPELEYELWAQAAVCTVAMIINDKITLGARPVSVAMHLAVANASWFARRARYEGLIEGWRRGCEMARCVWGPGETPALRDLVCSGQAIVSGSADGIIDPKWRLFRRDMEPGDVILILFSSGVHANGLTLCRDIAAELPEGYLTKLPDGTFFGESLLKATHIYAGFVADCQNEGLAIRYGVNITGHGWRKLMRAPEQLSYIIERLPPSPPIFDFVAEHGRVSRRNMFADYNKGAGFALYMPAGDAHRALELLASGDYGFGGMIAGRIEEGSTKQVVIEPEDIVFGEAELQVR